MYPGRIVDIDFDRIWAEQLNALKRDDGEHAAEYWNRRAATYEGRAKTSSYTDNLLSRMSLLPTDSVIDIGCGTGVATIPIARKVKRVTAVDLSPAMLDILKQKSVLAGVRNISILNRDWNKTSVGADLEVHDVVLCSRCLSGTKLSENLKRINDAAARTCYITWRAITNDDFKVELFQILKREYFPHPEYTLIYNALYKMGIRAKIEIFSSTNEERYLSIEEAVENFLRGEKIDSDEIRRDLAAFARSKLNYENNSFCRSSTYLWALIWWQKEQPPTMTYPAKTIPVIIS
jgi:SAM-dependent methyltransferase